jgi:hypothetical protein
MLNKCGAQSEIFDMALHLGLWFMVARQPNRNQTATK